MKPDKYLVLTLRDGTQEAIRKPYVKGVKFCSDSGYTKVTIHGTPDRVLKVQEKPDDLLFELEKQEGET